MIKYRTVLTLMLLLFGCSCLAETNSYPWKANESEERCIASEIQPPAGFRRTETAQGSFADWLRNLPLKKKGTAVLLHDGRPKTNQAVHVAVINIDAGTRNLQQCADAVIRLRAEYLYSGRNLAAIHFNFTSGDEASFARWVSGYRPVVERNKVAWLKSTDRDSSYASFREYLDMVFTYAGSHSLSRELKARPSAGQIAIGDIFIQGGFPGHAVIVVDMAEDIHTGEKAFLLAQSYMPAQDIHILRNPTDAALSPWYKIPLGDTLQTPQWAFKKTDLKHFAPAQ